MSSPIDALFTKIQKACLPGIWSKGVALSRDQSVQFDPRGPGESDPVVARVHRSDRPVAARVSLWPPPAGAVGDEEEEEGDWFCDCGDRAEVCAHAVAAMIALKACGAEALKAPGAETPGAKAPSAAAPDARLIYCFSREPGNRLRFERRFQYPDREERLRGSLVSFVGGVSSGRIAAPPIAVTREDFAIDGILSQAEEDAPIGQDTTGTLGRTTLARLLPALSGTGSIFLDGEPVRASTRRIRARVQLSERDGVFHARAVGPETRPGAKSAAPHAAEPASREWFANGAWLIEGVLSAAEETAFTPEERRLFTPEGLRFRTPAEVAHLVTELLPALEGRVDLDLEAPSLPRSAHFPPRAVLLFERKDDGALMIFPRVVYGDPPIAELGAGGIEYLSSNEFAVRDLAAEALLSRRLQNELHLRTGQWSRFDGAAAVDFAARARGWAAETAGGDRGRRAGGRPEIEARGPRTLIPRLELGEDGTFDLRFEAAARADADRAAAAWAAWDSGLGARVAALLAARDHSSDRRLPRALLGEAASVGEELGARVPDAILELRRKLETSAAQTAGGGGAPLEKAATGPHGFIPEAPLPPDLRAELRHYQRSGVSWLGFLRDAGLGAMLADDMGLGKTLQALCAIQGRALVVCPTSVLHSWRDQAARFRPGLKTQLYHGPGRALNQEAQLTITSYAVLRLDRERLTREKWDTVILDEAHTIKNPESQTALAAHELAGAAFRLTLSGTPVENRPEDLWSQFRFLNPGLLGTREDFREQASTAQGLERFRRKIRPFILRRLKREVAPELPPRTEVVLECELSAEEREVYVAVLAASRSEALTKLESEPSGRGVFAALEALLRLRQACCDISLIPGTRSSSTSSKVALLLEQLTESIAEGHRSLVFSQWTSFLDRIEPALEAEKIPFLRLDGSTVNREAVVSEFQSESGPPVLLISLKAGGVGLTLTAADHIFLMDPWWNPAVEDQAADRAHRIGQENPVFIHRLVASETVEQRILALQNKKRDLAGKLLSEGSITESLTREDLIDLLS